MNNEKLIEKLARDHSLTESEYRFLIENRDEKSAELLAEKADQVRKEIYDNKIFLRGLIEISNICKNDCYYCGIRKSNLACERYRLTEEEILECCSAGYELGFRTFVLQGGEDGYFTDDVLVKIVTSIKDAYPDCAVTLSLGERSYESYKKLREAGADRYLLRHETADKQHYEKLHPASMSLENRMRCLRDLKSLGYQVGCGIMVGSPGQTVDCIVKDLKFIEEFQPEMCGIGPFLPHKDTPFKDEEAGSVDLTIYLLSIIRLIVPDILLPATTALGTAQVGGREKGITAGANVVMPNLSPAQVRNKYELYDNKLHTGVEAAEHKEELDRVFRAIGYETITHRGDVRREV